MERFWKVLLGTAVVGGAGYAVYRMMTPERYKTLVAPRVSSYARMQATLPKSAGPWRPSGLSKSVNDFPVVGKRYATEIETQGGESTAVVEGRWKGPSEANKIGGTLYVDRLISASGKVQPDLPMEIKIPPSKDQLYNDYLQPTRWETMHPTSVGMSVRKAGKPAPGTILRYAMREKNSLGNSVLILEGRVLSDDSKYWPKGEEPGDDRVLIAADEIVKAVRGGGEISLPPAFVVELENLIVEGERVG